MSLEAEASVLGAAMTSDSRADEMLDGLTEGDFTRDAHRLLFREIAAIRDRGEIADTVTVVDRLGRAGRLDEAGGPAAIHDLTDHAFGTVEQWARQIRMATRRRHVTGVVARMRAEVEEVEDVDELVETSVDELLGQASSAGTVPPAKVFDAFTARVAAGNPDAGLKFPWPQLGFFRIPDDGLTTVTGLPTHGKSTWVDVSVLGMMLKDPQLKVAFFSPEMSPADNHLYELARSAMGCDPKDDPENAGKWAEWLLSRCHWIDDSRYSTPAAVVAQARRLIRNHGVRLLVIDPYNNLDPDGGRRRDGRQDLDIQALLRRLRRFGRSNGVGVVLVAHPKQTEKIHGTDAVFRIPHASDISGGQEWWNHSDAVVTVWRNASNEEPETFGPSCDAIVVVSKCRFRKWGRTGKATLTFNETERRYQ